MSGAFICQVSGTDWPLSRSKGVYGNRKNKPDTNIPLRQQDQLSVIRDLIAIRPADIIFFHVIGKESGTSGLHGPYTPLSEPYYDDSIIWENDIENFPFRFSFKPLPGYETLCEYDMSVSISDIYQAIETRAIWSLATLENERNMEKRAVRKISISDAKTILNIFIREFVSSRPSTTSGGYSHFPKYFKPLKTMITSAGRYENAVKAILLNKLADKDRAMGTLFGDYFDYVNETFVAPTTRKLMDILVISRIDSDTNCYQVVEAKNDRFSFAELRQLMSYLDLFRQRPIFRCDRDKTSACALAADFDSDTMKFRDLHNKLSPYDPLLLIQYKPIDQDKDALFTELPPQNIPFRHATTNPALWGTNSPEKDILSNASDMLPFYAPNKYVSRKIMKQSSSTSYIIEEKNREDNNTILFYYVFVWDRMFSVSEFHHFCDDLYNNVAPLSQYNFRAINPVIVSRDYEQSIVDYVCMYKDLSVRRPISLFQW